MRVFYWLVLLIYFATGSLALQAQGIEQMTPTMMTQARNLVEDYFKKINQLGEALNEGQTRFLNDDINIIISNNFEDGKVSVFNDITRVKDLNNPSFTVRNYLDKITQLYKKGIKVRTSLNILNPCRDREGDISFYFIKVEVAKELDGEYFLDDAPNSNRDSLDVYVRFVIRNTRPLSLAEPRIYKITRHTATTCIENKREKANVQLDEFDNHTLRKRAENFVADYCITLNMVGNPELVDRYNTTDYFESPDTKVYNDILLSVLEETFRAADYLRYIEKWYQEGITFDYSSIKATNVLTLESADYVSVEVEVDRTITVPGRNFRDRRTIVVFVKFPVESIQKRFYDDQTEERTAPAAGSLQVGAERSSPKIYKITKKNLRVNSRNYLAIGVQLNAVNYFGDLNPLNRFGSFDWGFTRPSLAFHISRKMTPNLFLRASLSFAQIRGDDAQSANPDDVNAKYRFIRNQHFRNNITELALVAIYEIFPNKGQYYRRKTIRPYLMAGVAVFRQNPQARTPAEFGSSWVNLRDFRTEGQGLPGYGKMYSRTQFAIPIGAGVKVRIANRIDIAWELGIRYTFTDYLDDVSGNYPAMEDLQAYFGNSGPLARAMSNRTLEQTAPLTGASRLEQINRIAAELYGNAPNLGIINYRGTDGNFYDTFYGFGRNGDQRGNPNSRDLYIFSGFHLTYFIRVGQPAANTGQRKNFRIDRIEFK